MNEIKSNFTIRDLENLTGIKAHTIRIWEKRYELLQPERTNGNIRYYDIKGLQKLLNIALLKDNGYKISKIALLSEASIVLTARELVNKNAKNTHAINALKLAMFNFDASLFNSTYSRLLLDQTFSSVFKEVFIPFLNHIGLLWQTDTLTPANEHFISNLIAQKIHINTEKLQQTPPVKTDRTYVLYLPEGEIHELGLLYLNYELALRGYRVVYLGLSIPLADLQAILNAFEQVYLISSFTVAPSSDDLITYLDSVKRMLYKTQHKYLVFGSKLKDVNFNKYESFFFYDGLIDLLKEI